MFVYTIRPVVKSVVKPVVKPVWQPGVSCIQPVVKSVVQPGLTAGWTNSTVRSTRLSNRLLNVLTTGWMFGYTMQPVVKPVVQPVWRPVVSSKRGLRNTSLYLQTLWRYIGSRKNWTIGHCKSKIRDNIVLVVTSLNALNASLRVATLPSEIVDAFCCKKLLMCFAPLCA